MVGLVLLECKVQPVPQDRLELLELLELLERPAHPDSMG